MIQLDHIQSKCATRLAIGIYQIIFFISLFLLIGNNFGFEWSLILLFSPFKFFDKEGRIDKIQEKINLYKKMQNCYDAVLGFLEGYGRCYYITYIKLKELLQETQAEGANWPLIPFHVIERNIQKDPLKTIKHYIL